MSDIFALIDMTSFTSVWYWIFLCLTWNSLSHRTLGVPFDMIIRADKHGDLFERDVDHIAHAQSRRLTYMFGRFGVVIIGVTAFFVSAIGAAAFVVGFQTSQAVFVVLIPVLCVGSSEMRLAYRIRRDDLRGSPLRRKIVLHRFFHQLFGIASLAMAAIGTAYYGYLDTLQGLPLVP